MPRDCKKFACHDCDENFTRSRELNKHRRIHTGEKPFACSDCDMTFTTRFNLNVHRKIHTGEKPFACPDCDKKFAASAKLNRHRRIHTGEKHFACPDCDNEFRDSNDLNRHRRIHTGEKPFACPDCDMTFTTRFNLNVHRRIHTGEKPFACPDCDMTFTTSSNMNRHRRIHTDEMPIAGTDCNCYFEQCRKSNTEQQQQLIHNIEKPFVCHVCEEPFSEESLLENHVKIHPDAEDFLCERNFMNFIEQRKLSLGPQMPVHTDDVSIVPSECNMICSASSGNCVLDGNVDDGDFHMSVDKLLDSSTSCSGNEESSADSFKLYGCGICCQSFSTKEETIHCFHSH